jgi:Pre-mRNA 3''-end processing (cleavage and polyadenylation) factor
MTVRKLAANPENVHKAKPIFAFLHEYESRYGDLVQVVNLETRMRELFPEDPTLAHFSHRYSTSAFDPTAVRPIISPSQARPKTLITTEQVTSQHETPVPRYTDAPSTSSPKRAFPLEELDDDMGRPRKFIRAESPLKTAAGRRLDQKQTQAVNGILQARAQYRPPSSAAPLPRDVVYLLSIIPPASAYNAGRFSPEKMVDLLRRIDIPSSISQLPTVSQTMYGLAAGQPQTLGIHPATGKAPVPSLMFSDL